MPIQNTQKFAAPSQDEGKFLAQLERYTQQIAGAINSLSSYDYRSGEQPTGASYLFLDRPLPVYAQTLKMSISSSTFTQSLSIQSPNQGVVFVGFSGSASVGGVSYPIPYYSGTDNLFFNVNASGNITINATSGFVGGTLILTALYVYIF
jgi:hypothetical protein